MTSRTASTPLPLAYATSLVTCAKLWLAVPQTCCAGHIATLEASISINKKTIDEFQLTIHNLQRNAILDANTIFGQKTKIDQQAWRLNELRTLQTNYATLEKNFETQRAYAEMLARKVSELEIARNTLAHIAGDNVEGIIGDIATFLRGCKRTHSEMAACSGV